MILIGLGSNLVGTWGEPPDTIQTALEHLDTNPLQLIAVSRLISTAPFGKTDQPDFVNAVAQVETTLSPHDLMKRLHEIEDAAERVRGEKWGPRTLDLDLLDYNGLVIDEGENLLPAQGRPFQLPHPGIAERQFVLESIAEIAPGWQHPLSGKTAAQLSREIKLKGKSN